MNRMLSHVAAMLSALLLAGAALAQGYPAKPIRIILGYPPGSAQEGVARLVTNEMMKTMNQTIVFEIRAGANGSIAGKYVSASPPDGYTVMVQSTTHVANAHLYKKLPYDVLKDFIGVTTLARQVGVLLVHPSLPTKTGKELLTLAKKRPGDLIYASSGNGSYAHMSMALFMAMAKVNMVHIPYKGGGPANIALVAGETQVLLTSLGSVTGHIEQGRVRALGVSSPDRSKQFPNLPAIAEFVPGYDFVGWVGCFVPAGTPRPVVDALNAALKRALEDPEISSKLLGQTLDPLYSSPEQFAERLRADYSKYAEVVRISGARVE